MSRLTLYAVRDIHIPLAGDPPQQVTIDRGAVVAEIEYPHDVEIDPRQLASFIRGAHVITDRPEDAE